VDILKSLQELDNKNLPISNFESHLVDECIRLYKLPLSNLSIENLRLLIGQNIGLKFLVPIALSELESNPLSEGDLYAGDLLESLIKLPSSFWQQFPDYNNRIVEIKITIESIANTLNNDILPKLKEFGFA